MTISPSAAAFLAKKGWPLRISVRGGGCAGMQYRLEIGTAQADDRVLQEAGATVLIDPRSAVFLRDCILDMASDNWGSKLIIRNPHVRTECGCGESFSV